MESSDKENPNSAVVDTNKHQIVMQVTQADSQQQLAVIGQIKNIKKALPQAEIEVVVHSHGLALLLAADSKAEKHINYLSEDQVKFVACQNTLDHQKVTASELLPKVGVVPSGLVEIVLKQEEGWAYVKGGI